MNPEAGVQRGSRAQGGNNILCVCGTNVDLYIQLSSASERRRASRDQSPWSRVRTQGASGFYPILLFKQDRGSKSLVRQNLSRGCDP